MTAREKEYRERRVKGATGLLAAIALLDVPAGELKAVVPDDPDLLMHLQDCRGHVKDALKKAGVLIRDRRASAGLGPEWTGRNE